MSRSIDDLRRECDESRVEVRAELAKNGIQDMHESTSSSRSDLIAFRADLRRVVNSIRDDLLSNYDGENSLITGKKRDEWDRKSKLLDALTARIELCSHRLESVDLGEKLCGAADKNAQSTWNSDHGRIRLLGPRDQMAEGVAGKTGFGFGEYVAAMVRGTGNPDIRAALSEGTDSAGGYTVPTHLMQRLIDMMRSRTVAIQAGAITVPLETEKTTIARLESDPQAGWRLEEGAVAVSSPTFGAVTFTARSLACLVKVSRELLEDSVNIDQALMLAFAGAMGGELDRVALFGSGTAPEPRGVANTSGISEVSMGENGAALSGYGEMLDAIYELENANASPPTAWVLAPRTSRVLNGLTDTTGQPLRPPQAVENVPRLTSTVVPVDQTQGTAENASSIIVGDFSQLLIGVRTQLRIEVLREAFAANMQYAFIAHLRADIAVAQPKGFAIIKGIIPS